ncbi:MULTISPECIES: hypothetical protein [Vibrio]|uniref:hypothetical protein n=1 Tax=Vibrio TaxID=662 RepID=UPI000633F3AB|nr:MULTISPECIES: hypothetical protein [Vibrio]PME40378.1 hypothetical protein BCV36_21255 [Vibrio cyclitrophicus]PME57889.1 hypothetical protein BCV37_22100 [Vibrio cyclitrophicus]PMJ93854.1 hypothetical protein BCU10_09425 [Vibrio splendidus]CDT23277.1 conserved hypothetical protein [Vibrio coralliirubri]
MNTKSIFLEYIHRANTHCDSCLNQLFALMTQAVMKVDSDDIAMHLMNGVSEPDLLLLIVLTDIGLTTRYDELILATAVTHVMNFESHLLH